MVVIWGKTGKNLSYKLIYDSSNCSQVIEIRRSNVFMSFYRFVCIVNHPKSGRKLECYSNQPGVQFYTGNFNHKINVDIVFIWMAMWIVI